MSGQIRDEAHLNTVPDGTIISWQRIPGDPTSEAVAFVRREMSSEHHTACKFNECLCDGAVVWISPGGWQPMPPDEAGVTYPATVVRWGAFTAEHYLGGELATLGETLVACEHGGTWAREKALEAAVILYAGCPEKFSLDTAEHFEHWLDRDVQPPPPEPECAAPTLGDMAATLAHWRATGVTLASVMYALNQVWVDEAMGVGRNDNR